MKELMTNNTFALLESWAKMDKDKERPALHPDDEERWLKFVVAAFREGVDHGAVENGLENWLVEEQHWMVPQAEGMVKRYGEAIAVLKEYAKG